MSSDIKQFIRENEALFWGVKPDEKENISLNVLVETILSYGDEKRVESISEIQLNQWVHLVANEKSPCVFTRDIKTADYPIRHGEGKFIADQHIVDALIDSNQVVLQYSTKDGVPANGEFPLNPNGSIADIAGICDPTGKIFGLMPHPEAYNHFTNHPDWTRDVQKLKREGKSLDQEMTIGVKMFKNGVDYIKDSLL